MRDHTSHRAAFRCGILLLLPLLLVVTTARSPRSFVHTK